MQERSRTGYNKEHIIVLRWRLFPVESSYKSVISNSPHERSKILVLYHCGFIDTYDHSYKWDRAPENRKMCRKCVGLWISGEISSRDLLLDEDGKYQLPSNWSKDRTWRQERKAYREHVMRCRQSIYDKQLPLFTLDADGNVIQEWKYDRARNYSI